MALTRPRYSQIYDTDYKQSVRLATTVDVGNLLATGNMTNTVDGRTLVLDDRILVKDQTDSKQNGIYRVADVGTGSDGTWVRALDADASDKVTSGLTTTVSDGDVNAYKTFKLGTPDPITLGATLLNFVNPFAAGAGTVSGSDTQVQFNDLGTLGATAGLRFNKTSNVLTIGGNVTSSGNIVSGGYFIGNGSLLTGIDATSIQNGTSNVKAYSSGNVTVSVAGTANVAVFTSSNIHVSGSILPSANIAYDLGSPTHRFRSGYFSGNTVYIGSESISVDSTGKWTFTSGNSSVDFGTNVAFNPTSANIAGNLIVGGNLTVNGDVTYLNVDNIITQDPLIYLANGNTADFLDIGLIGNFTRASTYQHTGIARDATDGVWKLFENVVPEPTTTIDFGSATYATLKLGNVVTTGNIIVGSNLRVNGALLTSAGVAGDAGQYLTSTGSGLAWTTLEISSSAITDGDTNVTASTNYVNVTVTGSNIAEFSSDQLTLLGNLSVTDVSANLITANLILASTWSTTGNYATVVTNGTTTANFNPTTSFINSALRTTGSIYTGSTGYNGTVFAESVYLSDHQIAAEAGELFISGKQILTDVTSPYLGLNSIIRTNDTTISANVTIPSGTNGMSAGPITIASGVVVTVTGDWSIV